MTSERRKKLDKITDISTHVKEMINISNEFLNKFMKEFEDLETERQMFILGRVYSEHFLMHSDDVQSFQKANAHLFKAMRIRVEQRNLMSKKND